MDCVDNKILNEILERQRKNAKANEFPPESK